MYKRVNNFYRFVIIFITIGSCFLYFRTRLSALALPEDYIRSCTDFGQYLLEVYEYSRGQNIIDLMKVAEEPGIFLNMSSLIRVANIPEKSALPFFSMIMYCMIAFVLAITTTRFFPRENSRYKIGFIVVLFYISLYGTINSQVAGIWRQVLGQMYILLIIMSSFYKNNKRVTCVMSLFVGMSFLSHTFSTMVVIGSYALLIAFNFFLPKNRRRFLRKYILILFIGFLITSPYLYYFFRGYVYDYAIYLFKYMLGLSVVGTGEFDSGLSSGQYLGNKYTGFNFFGSNPDNLTPALFYVLNYGIICIVLVSNLRKSFFSINHTHRVFFSILMLYVCLKIDFSTRALLTFELVILPIIVVTIFKFYNGRLFKLLVFVALFFSSFVTVTIGIINKNFSTNIINDTSVSFIRDNFSNRDDIYFMARGCSSDLIAQLGINSALNYHLNLKNARKDKAEGKLDFTRMLSLTASNMLFLERSPVLFNLFQDKDVYIIFTKNDWMQLPELNSGKHKLLNKPYLDLIYSNTNKGAQVRYIFRVKKDDISYTDAPNYIYTNRKLEDELNQ